jgi:hypothetical protein
MPKEKKKKACMLRLILPSLLLICTEDVEQRSQNERVRERVRGIEFPLVINKSGG